jgi:hypothetical protein
LAYKGHRSIEYEDKMMKKFLSGIFASALAATFTISGIAPINAAPVFIPKAQAAQTDVIKVGESDYRLLRRQQLRFGDRRDLRIDRRDFRRDRSNFRRDGRYAWYNGHRGYPYYRHGHRHYNGFWFPAGAFIAGAIIGNALNQPSYRNYGGGSAHVDWCYDRYRSYRASDNTFQPYNGPRRQCYSPYS